MITTVTLNAAVDKLYIVENSAPHTVMRVKEVHNTPGGKGLNVAKVARLLGEDACATGFLGGFNGQMVRALLAGAGIRAEFAQTAAETRCCVNIREAETGRHTEYLEPGAPVTAGELAAFYSLFEQLLPESGLVTISGSTPAGVPADCYGRMVRAAKAAGKRVIVDTSGQLLRDAAKERPTMLKPNTDEIGQLLGAAPATREETAAAAQKLHAGGIDYVAVSLGGDGAVLACREGVFAAVPPPVQPVNVVGCGDAMVAAFAVGILRGMPAAELLRFATAVSAANALELPTGHISPANLERLSAGARVEQIL